MARLQAFPTSERVGMLRERDQAVRQRDEAQASARLASGQAHKATSHATIKREAVLKSYKNHDDLVGHLPSTPPQAE